MSHTIQPDLRRLVVGVDTPVPLANGTYITAVNFDNAATTPPFYQVLKEVNDFSVWYSSIHRGKGYKSALSSEIYESAREIVKQFIGADRERDTVIFTKNTTESINLLAHTLHQQKDGREVVISTWMEHAANDLPWRDKFTVVYAEVDSRGKLCLDDLEAKLRKYAGRVRLVTVTGASNVTGYINPVYNIAQMVHRHGVEILVDGAQLIPHTAFDMKCWGTAEHIDYLAFSGHKMYAPFGSGVLIGPKRAFEQGIPYCTGGGDIKLVTHDKIMWDDPPGKDEAGTPNLMGVVALIAAIKILRSIGMNTAYSHEKSLFDYAVERMQRISGVKIYCNSSYIERRIGVIPFNLDGISHGMLAAMLSYEAGIAVRNGFFCSHPYCERLLGLKSKDMEVYFAYPDIQKPGLVRVSFGVYNRYNEIDRFVNALTVFSANKGYYLSKYNSRQFQYAVDNEV